ncbi:MAG: CotH kinase family protein [Bacteroidota bacterium]
MKKNTIFCCLLLFLLGSLHAQDFYDINEIREIRLYFSQPNWDDMLDSLFEAGQEERLQANISIDGFNYDSVGVRYKGYSSVDTTVVKNPLNIDLDCLVPDQEHFGITKIKLSNVIHDPTFIREVLSYEIARKYMPSSRANFAYVFVNDTLLGLYTNVEAVNKDFTNDHFESRNNSFFKGNPETLIYPYGSNSNLQYYDDDTASYFPYYTLESDYGWADLHHLIYTLNNEIDSIDKILNTDRALWMIAFDYSLVNLDSYIAYSQNYYLYQDNNKRFNTILWDLNMSFGSFRFSDGSYGALSGGITITQAKNLNPLGILTFSVSPRPLIKNLLQDPTRKRMYLAHIRTIINENFVSGEYYTRGLELQSIIDTCVQNDTNKFYSYVDFLDNMDITVGGSGGMIQYPGIADLMEARITYLSDFSGFSGAPVISDINHIPQNPVDGDNIIITAKISYCDSCFFAYRYDTKELFTKLKMFDDGLHNDYIAGDSIFGVSVTASGNIMQYYFYAENDTAGAFSPERAEYEYYTLQSEINPMSLVINEVMAENASGKTDQNQEREDWIEFYNNTANAISLKGLCLSDNPLNIYKWSFPDTMIGANNYLIVWADEDGYQQGLHANFKIDKSGEPVYLSFSDGAVIDSVILGIQSPDTTTGRYPNGTGPFVIMSPSFSCENFPLSYQEIRFDNNIIIYPNPADEYLFLSLNNINNDMIIIEIYDISGKLKYRKLDNNQGEMIEKIDVSSFSQGLYLIKTEIGSDKYVAKFIISE